MIPFVIVAAGLIAVALLLIVPPLFRTSMPDAPQRRRYNIELAREQLALLEQEAAAGEMPSAEYEQRRAEIERVLADALAADRSSAGAGATPAAPRWTAAALVLLVPVFAMTLYVQLGHWPAVSSPVAGPAASVATAGQGPDIEAMVERLAARLEQEPDNAEGWLMLGRSYMVMKRYREAADAFERARALVGDNPVVLLLSAEALAMANGGRFSGRPSALIDQSLGLDPDNPMGLWMAGMAASQRGDDRAALAQWQRLRPMVTQDSAAAQQLDALIGRAEARLGGDIGTGSAAEAEKVEPGMNAAAPSPDRSPVRIEVDVRLAPELAGRISGDETLFVFARALDGPPMPLAIVRRQAKELPLRVTLDDSMAMAPTMKLSKFPRVRITARISRSGQAMPQSGDLEGERTSVDVGGKEPVTVVVNRAIR